MQRVGQTLRQRDVTRIYLVHGTFVGHDAGGLIGELARFMPGVREQLAASVKQGIDWIVGDRGNFTVDYARRLREALGGNEGEPIDVQIFRWSSENHHLGRADGAVRLLAELLRQPTSPQGRTLLVGHSHAGNVFALLTQLLSGDRDGVATFFDAARCYYEIPLLRKNDVPEWSEMRERLREQPQPIDPQRLDLVTLGTPIRYGWNPQGFARLLHLVSHRPSPGLPPHLGKFPPTLDELNRAVGGDYVQQFGIAGTNTPPNWLMGRSWLADARLHRLLQRGLTGGLFERLSIGQRVPDTGETLLVDYGEQSGSVLDHLAGHAVYTLESQMLFLAEQIAEWYSVGPTVNVA
jgi:hypothetical protein